MKKGFTIVEIIITISFILIIGVFASFIVFNNKNDSDLEKLTKQVLEAANLYINVETDEFGQTYKNGILNGAKGVQITVKNLVDNGYIDDNILKNLEHKTNKTGENLYILVGLFTSDDAHCGENSIEITSSWTWNNISEPTYLCGYKKTEESLPILNKMLNDNQIKLTIPDLDNYQDSDKGLYILPDDNGNSVYYYGKVENNYLEFNGLLWRIIRRNGDGTTRIILDDTIDMILQKGQLVSSNNKYDITTINEEINYKNNLKQIVCVGIINGNWLCFYDAELTGYPNSWSPRKLLNTNSIPIVFDAAYFDDMNDSLYYDRGYFKYITRWFSNTITETEKIKLDSIYCRNYYNYKYSERNFVCEETASSKNFINPVGTISYKELKYSGRENSYLTDINKSFYTADFPDTYYIYTWSEVTKTIGTEQTEAGCMNDQHELYIGDINGIRLGNYSCRTTRTPGGLRPVLNLKENLCVKGIGTKESPYTISECK